MYKAKIAGAGHYVPENIVTNNDLALLMDTDDEWIRERTGIEERRWPPKPQNPYHLIKSYMLIKNIWLKFNPSLQRFSLLNIVWSITSVKTADKRTPMSLNMRESTIAASFSYFLSDCFSRI